jgi:hypothetical protein
LKLFGLIGPNDTSTDDGSAALRFYSFTSFGTRPFTDKLPSSSAYFSLDGGNTKLANFGVNSDPSDFLNTGVQGGTDPFNTNFIQDRRFKA